MKAGAWVLIVIISAAIGVSYAHAAITYGLSILLPLWFFIGLTMGTVCHELGHLLCATLGSIPVRFIQIGVGPILWRRRFRETSLELRLLPFSGFVGVYPAANIRRYRWALFTLGGVLGNVAVIGVVAGLTAGRAVSEPASYFLGAIVFAQAYLIIATLIPFWCTVNGNRIASDGLQILQLLWARGGPADFGGAYAALLSSYRTGGNHQPTMSLPGSRVFYQVIRTDRWTDKDARRDFREALLRELDHRELSREEQMLVLDALVSDALTFRDGELRSRLDEWSLRALQLGPETMPLRCTRGAVLVELGRFEEAKALLEPIATANQAPNLKALASNLNALVSQVFLALAEHALGNVAAARQFANAARATAEAEATSQVVPLLLARLEGELGDHSVSTVGTIPGYLRSPRAGVV